MRDQKEIENALEGFRLARSMVQPEGDRLVNMMVAGVLEWVLGANPPKLIRVIDRMTLLSDSYRAALSDLEACHQTENGGLPKKDPA